MSVGFRPREPPRLPRLEHVRDLWQMHRPQRPQAVLTAAIYQTDTGLERGAAFATVATVMGWSAGTAMRMAKRYGHIGKSAQRDALGLLDPAPTPSTTIGGNTSDTRPVNAQPTVH